ncbi:hypothetical protein [Clostridium culturomicium]|uniref:hypothetical protein n=1 Tax=Clostridium culturomicium TaxID=1499683 RepID=UPI0038576C7D
MNQTKANKKRFNIPKPKEIENPSKNKLPISKDEIENARIRAKERLQFSFRFLNIDNEAFNLGSMEKRRASICGEWFIELLKSFKSVSDINRDSLISQRQHYDAHGHDWKNLDYKFEFSEDFLEQVECMQYRISSSNGRVHGFIIGNTFYIVWLDPHHNLYPDDRYGGRKFYMRPLSCHDRLQEKMVELLKENNKLKKENEEIMDMLNEYTQ